MKFFSFWRSLASFRVRIALNLKNIPAEVIFVDLDANAHRDPEYRRINPQMALPALVEDDGTTLFQSLAILEYLDEKYPSPPLLNGFRGAPKADVPALSQLISQISQLAAQFKGEIAEIELNPVLVHGEGHGVTIVDALVVGKK